MPTFYVSPSLAHDADVNDKPLGKKLNDPPRTYRDLYARDLYEQYETAKGRKEFAQRRRKLEADLAELETLLNDPERGLGNYTYNFKIKKTIKKRQMNDYK